MTHLKGLHEAGGLRTLRTIAPAAERSQLTSRLSRLDHQRSLLQRQLAVWTEKQQVTKHRLALLDKEIAQTGRLIRDFAEPGSATTRRRRPAPAHTTDSHSGANAAAHHDVTLEY
ncbi:MAG: hypothetical protein P4M09_20000 [Devosia sp.]|nr:hypothetical protein [Devosia sp.]